MQSAKEAMSNAAASAKSGMEKTKATTQEKVDKMKAHDPVEKGMATERKDERKTEAEFNKEAARHQNAATKQTGKMGGLGREYTTDATHGTGTGTGGGTY